MSCRSVLGLPTQGARGIRRGCSLAISAGTYEFAREHPATSRAPAEARAKRVARRPAACERARKFRRRERAGLPGVVHARDMGAGLRGRWWGTA
jgi:hypothetical protein